MMISMDTPTLYCEWINGTVHQPINTLTNIAFLLAAILAFRAIQKSENKELLISLLPFSIALIGIGSALWHHQTNTFGDLVDTLSIGIFVVLIGVVILKRCTSSLLVQTGAVVLVLTTALSLEKLPYLNGSLVYVFLFSVLGIALSVLSSRGKAKLQPALTAISLLVIGLTARTLDVHLCTAVPYGTHFVWHITTAAAAYFITRALVVRSD